LFSLRGRRITFAIAAVLLYVVSISGAAYEATTPLAMHHHILLRKIYAEGAFALLGFLLARADLPYVRSVAAAGIAIGLYSYAIELGQIFIDQAYETFAEHGFDVASGLSGALIGAWIAQLLTAPHDSRRRREGAIAIVVLAILVWGFTVTYGLRDS
jgi:VanZ family protein